ncbi:MAG: hypothetical protein ABIA21_01670 [Candidatus Aenigmatarchaeota archaeon]
MVTTSQIVRKYIESMPAVHECLGKGLISYGSLAKMLLPKIEGDMGKGVKLSAIVMALRRYSETMTRKYSSKLPHEYIQEVSVKSNILDVLVQKSTTLYPKLRKLYEKIDPAKGDILNVVQGDYETAIVTNMRHEEKLSDIFDDETILWREKKLAMISVKISKEYVYTPGVILKMVQSLNWEGVNIFEIVSTLTEINFIVSEKDATKGYEALQTLLRKD